ncbi:hypothetical protein CHGG_00549 [Chaetomium globosum CBS 148.51]|uniref:Ribosomal RNA-processing protein 7 C-terminal domain-containing protein n=1 Tax=Chaetomium globosum (strain ATCC 6205 / CBS 148.51 / DSM 1962 / NBRC 6347 / NRRL 1970) TaxID=306901 RepID=Q2HGV5_CHAGB|nr:uncharacterized protein CHGG_00549 [Chaetomium globosum CBS 148.51]EAQ92314.1 hypothetical protein CHGG_00549 [Chaetomium globosum CBS 148.51]
MASGPATIGEFSILPVSIAPLPSFPKNVVHYLYVRRNAPKIPTVADARSLFLTNVPVDSTEAHLRALFASLVGAGRFESATFEDERKDAHSLAQSPIDAAQPAHAARLLQAHGKKRKREDEEAERAQKSRGTSAEHMDSAIAEERGGRAAPASRNEAEEAKRKMLERQDKKKEELTNFYRFQLRERKKEEQAELLKKFEDDRRKLEAMRVKRGKFVPEA